MSEKTVQGSGYTPAFILTPEIEARKTQFHARYVIRPSGCWEWTTKPNNSGYPVFFVGNKIFRLAHRVSWLLHYGDIPFGRMVCHTCDNRICVNPDHLYLGLPNDNAADASERGRLKRGVDNPQCKLSPDLVLQIYRASGSIVAIARRFSVPRTNVSNIKHGYTWSHLTGAEYRGRSERIRNRYVLRETYEAALMEIETLKKRIREMEDPNESKIG